ncbi:restriction endonuclease [Candidatus Woesearchaeota archaeon]|nr:restriction endonuclease [Candidatus Woesearchaeota archaeon]
MTVAQRYRKSRDGEGNSERRRIKPSPEVVEQSKKFECYVAGLLYDSGIKTVRWDVYYTHHEEGSSEFDGESKKHRESRRQVDVQYTKSGILGLLRKLVIIECKYSSNPNAHLGLDHFIDEKGERGEKSGQRRRINNLADEIDEKRIFVGADYAILVSNAYFTSQLRAEARRQNLELWDRDELERMDKQRRGLFDVVGKVKGYLFGNASLEEKVAKINIEDYRFLRGS